MGISDSIKQAFTPNDNSANEEFDNLLNNVYSIWKKNNGTYWSEFKVNEQPVYDEIKTWPADKKVAFLQHCIEIVSSYHVTKGNSKYKGKPELARVADAFVDHLFKTKLIFSEIEMDQMLTSFIEKKRNAYSDYALSWPINAFVNTLIKQYSNKEISNQVRNILNRAKDFLNPHYLEYNSKDILKIIAKIDAFLTKDNTVEGQVVPAYFYGDDRFSTYANAQIKAIKNTEVQNAWFKLIVHVLKTSGGKPSKKFATEGKKLVDQVGAANYKNMVQAWFEFVIQLPMEEEKHYSANRDYSWTSHTFLTSVSTDALKGLVWLCAQFHDKLTLSLLADLAVKGYKKIPNVGPMAGAMGNAVFYTLFQSKGIEGIGHLSRLKLKIKQNNALNLINKYLEEAAESKGISLHEIEDLAVDDFGLIDGIKTVTFDDFSAELAITSPGKSTLKWYKPDGSEQKSIPAAVRTKHKTKLTKLKNAKKQIDQTTSAQRDRIDRMLRIERVWSLENFKKLYLEHGLMSALAKNIIWLIGDEEHKTAAIFYHNKWVDHQNADIIVESNLSIKLWHPAYSSVAEIEQWRNFLTENEIQQPVKQAYRELYLLTDAEITTRIYSNRMAAHILKQHQFINLARVRNWKASLHGAWDVGYQDIPEITIPEYHIAAQFWIEGVQEDDAFNDSGIWNYVSTDQIRFINTETNEPMELIQVPKVIFSEVLRDVDLFLGVASIGNDPAWQDNGGLPQYREYWENYSFGELSEIAKNRKGILEKLVPRLKIRNIAKIEGKFLIVKGKLRTYKIHIGSTNILMEPNDQYLCIVPDRSKKDVTSNVFIPFDGDSGLSVIISKALMLAEDDKMTDTTITSQINLR